MMLKMYQPNTIPDRIFAGNVFWQIASFNLSPVEASTARYRHDFRQPKRNYST